MTRPWQTLASAETPEGLLELRRRGESELVITVGGRVLMNGAAHRSEAALAELACRPIAGLPRPRVLIGGLGMGYTLRAALGVLPRRASVTVAEIDPVIVEWCRGPLAEPAGRAVDDPRVAIEIGDVAAAIARAAAVGGGGFDAILLDLYEGPRTAAHGRDDPLYGRAALASVRAALNPGGVFAVWSEEPDAAFESRLGAAGFTWKRVRPGRGGPRHTLYLAAAMPARASRASAATPKPNRANAAAPEASRVNAVLRRTSRAGRGRPGRRRPRRGPT
ncbi:MAG TPA: spermidine synthase [Thermoanaerobaculia bacterium]|nr:spermidine synthase [Thermoanaerobaculia bacterium]